MCAGCIRKNRKIKTVPAWYKTGYRKQDRCEMCNFRAKLPEKQLFVFYVDGNLKNNGWHNLKTVCANCRIEIAHGKMGWRPSPIIADF
jgi:hypothetical protein